MTEDEKTTVKTIVDEAVSTAFLRVRYWIVVSVLANVISLGIPGAVACAIFYSSTVESGALAQQNKARLDERSSFITSTELRLRKLEDHLAKDGDFEAATTAPTYQ